MDDLALHRAAARGPSPSPHDLLPPPTDAKPFLGFSPWAQRLIQHRLTWQRPVQRQTIADEIELGRRVAERQAAESWWSRLIAEQVVDSEGEPR